MKLYTKAVQEVVIIPKATGNIACNGPCKKWNGWDAEPVPPGEEPYDCHDVCYDCAAGQPDSGIVCEEYSPEGGCFEYDHPSSGACIGNSFCYTYCA